MPVCRSQVLSFSGTFVDQQSPYNPASPRGAWEYAHSIIPASPRKDIRVWMHVSDGDLGAELSEATLHNWVLGELTTACGQPSSLRFHTDGAVLQRMIGWLTRLRPRDTTTGTCLREAQGTWTDALSDRRWRALSNGCGETPRSPRPRHRTPTQLGSNRHRSRSRSTGWTRWSLASHSVSSLVACAALALGAKAGARRSTQG